MVKINEIVTQNPWWKYGKDFEKYDADFSRFLGPAFFNRRGISIDVRNIYIIRGSRRVGKTLYLKDVVRQLIRQGVEPRRILYLSLDFFTSRREVRSAMEHFLSMNRDADRLYLFLDEITSVKDWNLELKYLSDVGITRRAAVVATGSSGVALRKKVDLLPGRGIEGNEYYMKPLSFREFVLQSTDYIRDHVETLELHKALDILKGIIDREDAYITLDSDLPRIYDAINIIAPYINELEYLFNIYLVTGGFPQSINSYLRSFDGRKIDSSLAEAFVRNVLGDISKLGKQEIYARRIIREIINRYGTRYSFRSLASAIELYHATVLEYIETLTESFILTLIYPYDPSSRKVKYKGDKKIYLQDPFIYYSLQSYLSGIDLNEIIDETLGDEESLGRLIEGIICTHLILTMERPLVRVVDTFLWFYYNHSGREIDFIIETDGGHTALEVKYQKKVDYRDIYKIPQINRYIILSKEDIGMKNNVLMIPIPIFLVLLKKNRYNL